MKQVNDHEELLGRVQRVDPPPFLFTRIEARIAARSEERPSRAWVLATVMTVVTLLAVNTLVLTSRSANSDAMGEVAASMGMNASNQLYHE